MLVTKEISKIRAERWREPGKTWGFVPTMGMLHEGHLSLVKRALQENDGCIVSIFVNPAQFNNSTDFSNYPKDLEKDLSLLENLGVEMVFTPDKEVIYPANFSSKISLEGLAGKLEGAARPGHFDGVTTVVGKFFNITQPHKAYFGQKDAQQLLIIKKMVRDLNFNVEVIRCPTFREENGLAMSSRNTLLTPEQKEKAAILYQSLQLAKEMIAAGERETAKVIDAMTELINREGMAQVDYISINDRETLEEFPTLQGKILISLAVFFDQVRLIDNVIHQIE
ncbi:MAG: pantoate--beta-alanine ligase [SAR324 cluster bacterium]|uniref:Pantothenate synthetase n=1 Tax=SAR324 cluster bacterium TaxID=2024889 RepID=A0A2A4T8T6_9DELT|nr:MAG: pantoate--beta-alanine ligase [SAR324 cluster bacterium]